jgi:PAS domain S-box-containing protein
VGFKRVIAAAVALALLVAGLSLFLVINQVGTLGNARTWVNHSRAVMDAVQQLRSSAEAVEEDARGYLISEDPGYLNAYTQVAAAMPGQEAQLTALVVDNPVQINAVRAFIGAVEQRRAAIREAMDAARTGGPGAARPFVAGGRLAMKAIRDDADSVTGYENDLLIRRTNSARGVQTVTLAAALVVSLVALTILTLGMILLARSNRNLEQAMGEARRAEADKDALSALTNAMFANVPDYLFVLNVEADDRFVLADINPAFAKAMNVTAERVRGRAIGEILPGEIAGRLTTYYRRVRAGGAPTTSRNELARLPGGPRTWETIVAPVPGAAGTVDRIIGSIRDITDRVRAEERLRDAQRMEAIGQLTGGVAHDFNNLLQVIRGNLELLEGAVANDPRAAQRLKNALYGADRAAQLTRQLLAFARRQPLEPQVINLSRLVSDMADLLRRTLGEAIEVETVVAGGLWNTIADPTQVESAILNLALNARDAMPRGGRLTVEITNAVLDESYARNVGEVAAGQYVMLAVSDTGEGMSEEVRARVFEPFFTTKSDGKGTGLGLSMVYGFTKQSNGHIQIYSEVGQGTTVKIYLPRSRQPETAVAGIEPEEAVAAGGRTILVVEDDAAVRAATVAMLDELGYRSLEAVDAASALDLMDKAPEIDLVFSDVVMPGPLRTRDFAKRLAELRPGLPILFTSGYTDNAIIHHGRLDEGVSLISKPYAKADLARKLSQQFAERVGD